MLCATLGVGTEVLDDDDPSLRIWVEGYSYELSPIWAGEGFPQDVDRALAQRPHSRNAASVPVLVARKISDTVAARLEHGGLGWADERGRARIAAKPGLLIARGGPLGSTRSTNDWRWSMSAGAVAELLLTAAGDSFDLSAEQPPVPAVAAIASALPVSAAQVSKVLQGFDRQNWTRKTGTERGPGAHRLLENPSELLSSWAAWHSHRHQPSVRAHATWRNAEQFMFERLAPALPDNGWCLTGWLAADMRAPFATEVPTITCYLEPEYFDFEIPRILDRAGLRQVETGGRVSLIRAEPQVLTLARNKPSLIASDPRIYADLLSAGARGEEAASHLREVVLGY